MKTSFTLILLFLLSSAGFSQSSPKPTAAILKEAYARAGKENKKVILIFHASWCGWCHKMEASINDPSCKKMFADNYVVAYLDVLENPEKKNLENPGSEELLTKYKAQKAGLPFWLILDAQGKTLADSQMRPAGASSDTPGDNIGCPASEKEVAYFINELKATSKLQNADLAVIQARFRKNEPVKTTGAGTN